MRDDQIALQLYTLRRLMAGDLPGTLRAVGEAGYRAVELAGLPEVAPATLRELLAQAGLAVVGAHRPLEELRDDLDGSIDWLSAVGCPRVIVPWLSSADRAVPDGVRRVATELGRIAETCAGAGIRLGYHNHDYEFEPADGASIWDVLLASLPDSVEIELDVYWAAFAGRDPVDLIDRLADRVRLLHMKDMAAGPGRRDAAPGDGVLPWPAIVEAGRRANVEWYVVEQDEPADPLPEVTRGLRYLRGLTAAGVRGGG